MKDRSAYGIRWSRHSLGFRSAASAPLDGTRIAPAELEQQDLDRTLAPTLALLHGGGDRRRCRADDELVLDVDRRVAGVEEVHAEQRVLGETLVRQALHGAQRLEAKDGVRAGEGARVEAVATALDRREEDAVATAENVLGPDGVPRKVLRRLRERHRAVRVVGAAVAHIVVEPRQHARQHVGLRLHVVVEQQHVFALEALVEDDVVGVAGLVVVRARRRGLDARHEMQRRIRHRHGLARLERVAHRGLRAVGPHEVLLLGQLHRVANVDHELVHRQKVVGHLLAQRLDHLAAERARFELALSCKGQHLAFAHLHTDAASRRAGERRARRRAMELTTSITLAYCSSR